MSTKSASLHLVKHKRHLSLQLWSFIPFSVFNFDCLLDIATDGCSNSKENLYLWFLISLISFTRKSRSAALASRVLYSRQENTNEEEKKWRSHVCALRSTFGNASAWWRCDSSCQMETVDEQVVSTSVVNVMMKLVLMFEIWRKKEYVAFILRRDEMFIHFVLNIEERKNNWVSN